MQKLINKLPKPVRVTVTHPLFYLSVLSLFVVYVSFHLLDLFKLSSAIVISLCLLLIYPLTAGLIGWSIKHYKLPRYLLVVFPIAFAILLTIMLPEYAIYFVPIYLLVGYLVYGFSRA